MIDERYREAIPSQHREVLMRLRGKRIRGMTRYIWVDPQATATESRIAPRDVFSLAPGPLLLTLESGLVVGFANRPSLASVSLWVERIDAVDRTNPDPVMEGQDAFPIASSDPVHSAPAFGAWIGRRIEAVSILQREADNAILEGLPREAAVLLQSDDGARLLFAHGLHDDSDQFSVLLPEQVAPGLASRLHPLPGW